MRNVIDFGLSPVELSAIILLEEMVICLVGVGQIKSLNLAALKIS